jgi:predicted negative regulator of RcsB-dependent stress response
MDRLPEGMGPTEADLIWEQYKGVIIGGLVGVVVLAGGFFAWQSQSQAKAREASLRFASAKTDAEFKQIAQDFQGEPAGGNALLMIAADQMEKKDYAGARATFEEFVQKNPDHALAPAGVYAIANLLENEGKLDEALARYKEIGDKYAGSFVADTSLRGQARVLVAKNDIDGARAIYQQIIGKADNDSPARESAENELKLLNRVGESYSEIKYTDPNPAMPGLPKAPSAIPGLPGLQGQTGGPVTLDMDQLGGGASQEQIKNALEAALKKAGAEGAAEPTVPAAPDAGLPSTSLDLQPANVPAPADSTAPESMAPPTPQEPTPTDTSAPTTTVPAATTPQTPGAPQP